MEVLLLANPVSIFLTPTGAFLPPKLWFRALPLSPLIDCLSVGFLILLLRDEVLAVDAPLTKLLLSELLRPLIDYLTPAAPVPFTKALLEGDPLAVPAPYYIMKSSAPMLLTPTFNINLSLRILAVIFLTPNSYLPFSVLLRANPSIFALFRWSAKSLSISSPLTDFIRIHSFYGVSFSFNAESLSLNS
jgi:hypothetical protein